MKEASAAVKEAWRDLLEKDDRTSPADYPDMALITFEEFAAIAASGVEEIERETINAAVEIARKYMEGRNESSAGICGAIAALIPGRGARLAELERSIQPPNDRQMTAGAVTIAEAKMFLDVVEERNALRGRIAEIERERDAALADRLSMMRQRDEAIEYRNAMIRERDEAQADYLRRHKDATDRYEECAALRAERDEAREAVATQNGVILSGTKKLTEARARVAVLEETLRPFANMAGGTDAFCQWEDLSRAAALLSKQDETA